MDPFQYPERSPKKEAQKRREEDMRGERKGEREVREESKFQDLMYTQCHPWAPLSLLLGLLRRDLPEERLKSGCGLVEKSRAAKQKQISLEILLLFDF